MNFYHRRSRAAESYVHKHEAYWLWFSFRALPTVTGLVMAVLLFTISPARSESMDPNGVQAGQMLMSFGGAGEFSPAVIQSAKVHFDISGMVATVIVEQSFRNDSEQWAEGIYAFPLPDQAAVRHMEMIVGDRRIVGKIKEKSIAKQIYKAAKKAGKKASLVEQQRPNLFTNHVANIGPGEEITVKLEYVQALDYQAGEFWLRFPMTITPRYMPGAGQLAQPSHQQFDIQEENAQLDIDSNLGWAIPADIVGTGGYLNRIEITARLDMGMPLAQIDANYHEIVLSRSKGIYDVKLAGGSSEMDRDFVLHWKPVTGSAPTAAVFTEQVGSDFYGLLMLVPPERQGVDSDEVLPREMIFVIDTSGSMGGDSIKQARRSLSMALGKLRPQDSFNIIEFNSSYRTLFRASVPANNHYVQKAGEFVRTLNANGGTEMLPALRAALATPSSPLMENSSVEQRPGIRQVIFITDGAIGNETQLFEEIENTLGHTRLFTVGIGSAPNSWFMRKAAQFGRGSHTHIGDTSEVAEKMQRLFEQISTPLTVNIQASWPGVVEAYPQRIPDLFAGQPVLVAFRFDGEQLAQEITVSGQMADKPWSRSLRLPNPQGSQASGDRNRSSGVASIWAREKIAALLDEKLMGRPEAQVRAEVLGVALQHSLMSPYTSFVAVEERISRSPNEAINKVSMPNSQPKGQSPQGFAYPLTATTGPANIFLGSLFLFLALMFWMMRQPELDREQADED